MQQSELMSQVLAKAAKERIPFNVLVELNYSCNLRCVHCYVEDDRLKGAKSDEDLSADELEGVFRRLAKMGTMYLVFSGGEPLLRKDFMDIARRARRAGLLFKLFTNATLLGEEKVAELVELKPVAVEVSLHGPTAAVHEAITRRPGSFDKAVAAVRALVGKGVRVAIKTSFMRGNFDAFPAMKRLAGDLGAEYR
ncbi:radical SAM protein, partial [Elusimicrobiota bacterium]